MKKLLIRLVLAVVVIVLVVGVVGYIWLNSIAKAAVEHGGTYAMGVETTVEKVSLQPFGGKMQMDKLKVANPKGFSGPHLMQSGKFDVELVPGSLMGDAVEIKKFELDGLDMYIEQKLDGSNISKIMKNLEKLGGDEPAEEEAEGTKVKVDVITIRNVVAHVKVLSGPELTIKIPEIEMKELTSDNAAGVALPVLVSRIVPAIIAAVLAEGQGVLPTDLFNGLNGDLSNLSKKLDLNMQALLQDTDGKIREGLKDVLPGDANAVGKGIEKTVGDTVGKLLGGATDANKDANKPKIPGGGLLEGILGGKKEQ